MFTIKNHSTIEEIYFHIMVAVKAPITKETIYWDEYNRPGFIWEDNNYFRLVNKSKLDYYDIEYDNFDFPHYLAEGCIVGDEDASPGMSDILDLYQDYFKNNDYILTFEEFVNFYNNEKINLSIKKLLRAECISAFNNFNDSGKVFGLITPVSNNWNPIYSRTILKQLPTIKESVSKKK